MNRMLCIVSALDPGGAETFLMKIFRVLPDEYKLDFVVFRGKGLYENEVRLLGGKIYEVPMHSVHPIKSLQQLRTIIKDNKYQNVLKMTDTPIGVFDVVAAKLGGASNVCVRSCNAFSDIGYIKKILCILLRPFLNILSNQKIAPSEMAGRYTFGKREFERGKVKILRNGVDLSVFEFNDATRLKVRELYNIKDCFVVGNVGRYTEQKNHKFLIEVFYEILKSRSDAVLLLVGEGEKRKEILTKVALLGIKDKVIFTGFQRDVASFYSCMDIYVHTAFYEGMPNAIIEAQANGLNCVVSDTITREANITGNVQYLPLNKPEMWSKCINEYETYRHKNVRDDFVKSGYDIESVKQQFINMFFGENNDKGKETNFKR